jgi:uncharacterized protein YkwD
LPSVRTWIASIALAAVVAMGLAGCGGGESEAATPIGPVSDGERVGREGVLELASTTTTAPPTTTTSTTTPPPAPAPRVVTARRAAPAPAPPPPPPPAPSISDEGRALQLVNGERSKRGLAPLQLSAGARSVARAWSSHMAASGLAHNPDLAGDLRRAGVTGWSSYGENVGYSTSVDGVHALFMGSGGHRQNILSTSFTHVGIGVVRAGGKVWVTMDFVGY